MARKKKDFDKEEVLEIIEMKFTQVGGILKKLTYNSVYTFNKEIANNPNFKRKNGELFNAYSFDFWCNSYKEESNEGKKMIDEFKQSNTVETVMGNLLQENKIYY